MEEEPLPQHNCLGWSKAQRWTSLRVQSESSLVLVGKSKFRQSTEVLHDRHFRQFPEGYDRDFRTESSSQRHEGQTYGLA